MTEAPAPPPHVELAGVTKSFPGQSGDSKTVIDTIDFSIARGEFLSIVGPSGCGKSTLLRMIANLDTPTAGAIQVHHQKVSASASFVFQEANLLPWRSSLKNVALPLELTQVNRAERQDRAIRALKAVNFTEGDLSKRPIELSGGMKMRVSLARALVTNPELLLLDEPFAALDDFLRRRLNADLQQRWLEQKWTGVFVTHNITEAVFLSSRILVLQASPGRIVEDIEVPLSFPRKWDQQFDEGFRKIVEKIEHALNGGAA
ncbi:ABC transporter ATP-binding protein [Calycomorphotria hydatis]|uniref:Aliphatic sulfonates import ATP-binding protein SsuB n=1 Tax=Calycomorphotria hydatis TaxID=2528027 RepID=A0A517T7K2_9PLAN|nr:ABC transporter ATP-binding protein [Calycomorphotria hydatis]QDT64356.1 Aliphatic sulfonates import ATP-binding protein SsuB [Calycomorphotria hydatis]